MLQAPSSRIHPEFDFDAAKRLFSADQSQKLCGEWITSPFDLFSVETLRDRHALRIGTAVPTDIFLMGFGEPDDPACTKVGGRPFWPVGVPWPAARDGSPLQFVAQFNFADSVDLVGDDLAQRILVILSSEQDDWMYVDNSLTFRWVDRAVEPDRSIQVPSSCGAAGPFFGAIHRAYDYPDEEAYDAALNAVRSAPYLLPILNATKIGGMPSFTQSEFECDGKFLCQLSSTQAADDVLWPWVNREEPMTLAFDESGIYSKKNCYVLGDMGNAYFFIDDAGEIIWHFDCG